MSEVKTAEIKLVTNALAHYLEYAVKTKSINLQEFVNFMEPAFEKAGYRTPPQGALTPIF